MSYHVETETNNGYRCSCCRHTYDHSYWVSDRDEALAAVPLVHEGGGYEVESVTVTDGATGQVIAIGRLEWAGGRGNRYQVDRWHGHVDGRAFEDLHGVRPGETWAQATARIRGEVAALRPEEAAIELRRAQAELTKAETEMKAAAAKLPYPEDPK